MGPPPLACAALVWRSRTLNGSDRCREIQGSFELLSSTFIDNREAIVWGKVRHSERTTGLDKAVEFDFSKSSSSELDFFFHKPVPALSPENALFVSTGALLQRNRIVRPHRYLRHSDYDSQRQDKTV